MSAPLASVQGEGQTLTFEDAKQQAKFELGACMAIYQWEDLQTAVDNQWGGSDSNDKRDWMVGSIVELFETSNYVDSDDIEDRLLAIMEDEFGVSIEDDTALTVGVLIIQLYKECAENNYHHIEQLYAKYQQREERRKAGLLTTNKVTLKTTEGEDDSDSNSDDQTDETASEDFDQEMQDETPTAPQGPIIDDDGFELVQKKGNRRR